MSNSTALLEAFRAEAEKRKGKPGECWVWSESTQRRNTYTGFRANKEGDYVHRLSCVAYVEPLTDEKLHVLHACDNPWCWNPEHLRAGTPHENIQEAYERGRLSQAQFTEDQVRDIYTRYHAGVSSRELAAEYHTTTGVISTIGQRKSHKRLLRNVPKAPTDGVDGRSHRSLRGEAHPMFGTHYGQGETNPAAKLTEEQVREIRRRYAAGETSSALTREFKCTTVHKICTGKAWRHVQ